MSRRLTVLAWLVIPTLLTVAATPAAAAASDRSTVDYVALGDSYAAGVGSSGSAGLCGRGPNGYPQQWASRNDPASFVSVACLGATTDDVRLFQLYAMSRKTDLVTVTIGGNDVGFVPAVASCLLSSDAGCAAVVQVAQEYTRTVMPGKLDATYRDIRRWAPNAKVVVLGYPRLFDATVQSCDLGGMTLAKRRVLNMGAEDLDRLIEQRAAAAGFVYADVRDEFDTHGICSASPWINTLTIVPPTASYHPNNSGYAQGYLPALSAVLN